MDAAPVEIARRYLEALADEDYETAYDLLDPDVEVVAARGTTKGRDAVSARWGKSAYEHLRREVEGRSYDQRNGFVRATTLMAWRWKGSGDLAYRTRVDGELTVRDGKIRRIETAVEHLPA